MDIMMVVQLGTFFFQLAVGLWLFRGFLLPICSIRLGLSGRSKYFFFIFSEIEVYSTSLTKIYVVLLEL